MDATGTPARETPAAQPGTEPAFDLGAPELYLNRELTWLQFNRRVLHEAQDPRTPLLERVKFLAITSANVDEFFMKRIGGLMQQVGAGFQERTVDGRTPTEQIDQCHAEIVDFKQRQYGLLQELLVELAEHGIRVARYTDLDENQLQQVREHYVKNVFPLITPLAMDPAHPFPFISNLSLNLLVTIENTGIDNLSLVRIKVPVGGEIARFVQIQSDAGALFVPIEEVIANNLDLLFPGVTIQSCELFRVTRNAMTEKSEESAHDLLELIESELRDRKFSEIVRLEVSPGVSPSHRGMLAAELDLDEEVDVFEVPGLMAKRDLFQIAAINRPELHDPTHHPLDHPRLAGTSNIFHELRDNGPLLLQHPYESFVTSVERFLRDASRDPKVLAIKMTLYRTASESNIIRYLIDAAQNGKLVAAAVELKARFDESANIRWANHLEEAGIHVSYGVLGLKTHSKVVFVVRRDFDGLRRYAHIGTGNYHAGTARIYSDLGMLTADPDIGADLTELFNYLTTGQVPKRKYRKLLPAPKLLKPGLLDRIRREIDWQAKGEGGLIQLKMNALEDADVTRALYEAGQAGVSIDLIVRDTCRLRPGIAGLSEKVRVISIVGRFLEHTRIFYFRNGGEEEYLIGSADCMKRNLESRVEVVVPVDTPLLRAQLREFIDAQLNDQRSAWDMHSDGSYVQRQPVDPDKQPSCQVQLIHLAEKRRKQWSKPRKKHKRGAGRQR